MLNYCKHLGNFRLDINPSEKHNISFMRIPSKYYFSSDLTFRNRQPVRVLTQRNLLTSTNMKLHMFTLHWILLTTNLNLIVGSILFKPSSGRRN